MNTTALAIIQPEELETMQRTAKLLAASGYFEAKGDGLQAIAMMATKIMAGRELGFGAFASANGIHIIKGKPAIGANLMAAAVKGSGRYDYRVREMSDKVCRIEFFERVDGKREGIGESTFTIEDARKAQTQNLDKFARNMLFARAMSNGVRWFTPDVFSGNAVYVPEELGASVDGDGNVIDTTYTVTQPHTNGNGRQVDTTTGEITESDVDFGMGVDNPFDEPSEVELKIINSWRNRTEAEMYAVQMGACENEFEAKNSLTKSVNEHGGKVTADNIKAIYLHFLRRQQEKMTEKEAQQAELVAA